MLIFSWGHQHSQDKTSFHSGSLCQHKISCHDGCWLLLGRLNFFVWLLAWHWGRVAKILWLQALFLGLTQEQNMFFKITKLTVGEKWLLSREKYWQNMNLKVRFEPSQFCRCNSFKHKNFWYLILASVCC